MQPFAARMTEALAQRQRQGLYRQRQVLDNAQGPVVRIGGRAFLNFCSNDYLGLAAHPDVVAALRHGASEYGAGSGASHLVCGHSAAHQALEEALAEFTGRSRALLYSSGYAANTGVLTALLQSGDHVFEDRLNHASLLDGGLHSGARFSRFPHNDVAALERKLARAEGASLVVVDGVFSMDGDSAPLKDLAAIALAHSALFMVDDAHGFGVLGETGAGSLEAAGLSETQVPILMGTLGKALGVSGAFIAGSELLIETLINTSRHYIYTTAMPPALAVATLAALRVIQREPERRERLALRIDQFRAGAQQLGLALAPSNTAIQPLMVGAPESALRYSQALHERGVLVSAIRPPTVPEGTSRLRITLSAAHTPEQVDQLLEHLAASVPQ